MEYKIVFRQISSRIGLAQEGFEKEVNKLISEGWKPQGGVTLDREKVGHTYRYIMIQAMIREEKPEEK